MWDPYAEFESATLPNGLTVHAAHWPERPWEVVGFLVHSGARQDPVGLEGAAHFVEHLASENSGIPQKEIEMFFKDYGGNVRLGKTGYNFAYYQFWAPTTSGVIAKALSMFGDMMLLAKLEKFVERERQVIIGEFNREFPLRFALNNHMRERKALHSGSWLERFAQPLGMPESVERITQADLQAYYDSHYTPTNMSIVCVGGMRIAEIVGLLAESPFAVDKKGIRTPLPNPLASFALPLETRYVFEMSEHMTTAVPVASGSYRTTAKIPGTVNVATIKILQSMLDETLTEEVREKRAWTYDIDASYVNLGDFYEFSVNCRSLDTRALSEIEKVIESCISLMASCEDLFLRVQRQMLANNFMIDTMARKICEFAAYDLTDYNRIVPLAECGRDVERVTMGDIRYLLRWLHVSRRWTFIGRP